MSAPPKHTDEDLMIDVLSDVAKAVVDGRTRINAHFAVLNDHTGRLRALGEFYRLMAAQLAPLDKEINDRLLIRYKQHQY